MREDAARWANKPQVEDPLAPVDSPELAETEIPPNGRDYCLDSVLRFAAVPAIVPAAMALSAHHRTGLRLRDQLAIAGVLVAGPQRAAAIRSL